MKIRVLLPLSTPCGYDEIAYLVKSSVAANFSVYLPFVTQGNQQNKSDLG